MSVEKRIVNFLVDTGAGVSIVHRDHVRENLKNVRASDFMLKSYSGQTIETLQILKCKLEFEGRRCECEMVVASRGQSILGRDALAGLRVKMNCSSNGFEINTLETKKSGVTEDSLRKAFPKLFTDELGLVKGSQHKVKTKPTAKAVQQKLRRLPLTVRDAVKSEIEVAWF